MPNLQRDRQHGAAEEFELVFEVSRAPSPARTSSISSQYNSPAAEIPPLLAAALQRCSALRGGRLSAKDSAQRAWSAGYWARFVLEGRIGKPRPSSPCVLANTTSVVLRVEGTTSPVHCEKASDYRRQLGDFQGNSLSHGFALKAGSKKFTALERVSLTQSKCTNGAEWHRTHHGRQCGVVQAVLAARPAHGSSKARCCFGGDSSSCWGQFSGLHPISSGACRVLATKSLRDRPDRSTYKSGGTWGSFERKRSGKFGRRSGCSLLIWQSQPFLLLFLFRRFRSQMTTVSLCLAKIWM